MISFTEYMNKSLGFRNKLTTYCIKMGNEAQETRNHLKLLDCFDSEARKNEVFRNELFKWFNKKTSTIELRYLSSFVGFDYWENIKISNIIDTFDTVNIK